MGKVSSYKSDVTIQLIYGNNKSQTIPSESIVSIVVDHEYEKNVMPIIYITMNITTTIYNMLVDNKYDGKIYLNTRLYEASAAIPLYKDQLKDQFIYFMSSNKDYRESLQSGNENVDSSYIKTTIGMMSEKLLNFNSEQFDGVYYNIDNSKLIDIITSGKEFVKDTIDINNFYEQILIPVTKSRSAVLKYLYPRINFYYRKYIYYTDFDKGYLLKLNRKVKEISKKTRILFNIDNLQVKESYYQGMEKVDDSYIIYLNAADVDFHDNDITDKSTNKIIVATNSGSEEVSLNMNTNKYMNSALSYIRANSLDQVKSIQDTFESNKTIVNLTKSNIDSSILTPDKIYTINDSNESYIKYNGNYSIIYKKDTIVKRGNEFNIITLIGLRPLPESEEINSTIKSNNGAKIL